MTKKEIVPSLLSADFGKLESEISTVRDAGATRLHLDVMDGHFVPNITFGPFIVEAIRNLTELHLETHLMIESPHRYIKPFSDAGSDTLIIHAEASQNLVRDLEEIRSYGKRSGFSLNPGTPVNTIPGDVFSATDHILIMTVHPGFGGQNLIGEAIEKSGEIIQLKNFSNQLIEIDGGVNLETIHGLTAYPVNLYVAGSAVFGADDPYTAFIELTKIVQNV